MGEQDRERAESRANGSRTQSARHLDSRAGEPYAETSSPSMRHDGEAGAVGTPLGAAYRVTASGEPFIVKGQTARALRALVKAGATGITPLGVGSWAFRLAAYVWTLRKHGLAIDTIPERHDGGRHARYVLRSAVRLDAAA